MNSEDFLNLLIHMARKYGWEGNHTEIKDFVIWCHNDLKTPAPVDLSPYYGPDNEWLGR